MTRYGKTKGTALLLALLAGACVTAARAGPRAEARVEVSVPVPPLQRLEVGGGFFSFPVPMPADYAAGYVECSEPVVLRVSSNVPWILQVRARSDDTVALRLGGRVGEELIDLGDDWIPVASGDAGVRKEEVRVFFRVPLAWDLVGPGVFEPKFDYRLSPAGGGIGRMARR